MVPGPATAASLGSVLKFKSPGPSRLTELESPYAGRRMCAFTGFPDDSSAG